MVEVHPGVFTKRFLHQYEMSNMGWIPVQQITLTVTVQTDLVTLTVLQVTVQHKGNKDFTRCSNKGNNNSQDRANNSQDRANNSQDRANNSQDGENNSQVEGENNSQDRANNIQEENSSMQEDSKDENNTQDSEKEMNRTTQRKELLYSCDFGTLAAERSLILEVHFVVKNTNNSSFLQPDFAGFVRSSVVAVFPDMAADFPGMAAAGKAKGECETVLTAHRPTLVQKILQSWDLLMGVALGKENT